MGGERRGLGTRLPKIPALSRQCSTAELPDTHSYLAEHWLHNPCWIPSGFCTFFYCCLITSNNFNQIIVLISEGNIIVEHSFHSFLNSFNAYSTPADSLKAAGIQRDPTSNTQPPVAAVESSSTRYSEPVVIKMSPPLAVREEEPKFDPYADDIDPYAVSPRMQVYMERQMRQKCCR